MDAIKALQPGKQLDYRLGGKVNVVEFPDRLILPKLVIPPSVDWMLDHQSPPGHCRNQWLIDSDGQLAHD